MERADRVLTRLEAELELPFFLKCMLPSNVSHGFWLHLPRKFCNVHLPNHDASIILVDEWGNEYKTSYLLERHGLSAGWRGFSIAHRLLKGDILIFHLTEPCKLQVILFFFFFFFF
ncbi:B3 domain-containing protein os01g0234100 [Phtheirospermum japonicum]|uniref:B3 domain-containing protein os01g0234100 n=1 Tax=Phtheirospermum japonicum TaxID=374723 RepID=A0A830BRC0_9LAMI|nr:B3 domain-containing protein os01g0234100 [Phtheirospermum japonicum]